MASQASRRAHRVNKFYAGYAIAMVSLALAAYVFTGRHGPGGAPLSLPSHFASDVIYVDLPRVSVDVGSGSGKHPGKLRMDLSLEVERQYAAQLEDYAPRITERLVDYMSRLDFDALSQPQATQIIRKYLVEQANTAGSPVPVVNVIFRQYLFL